MSFPDQGHQNLKCRFVTNQKNFVEAFLHGSQRELTKVARKASPKMTITETTDE